MTNLPSHIPPVFLQLNTWGKGQLWANRKTAWLIKLRWKKNYREIILVSDWCSIFFTCKSSHAYILFLKPRLGTLLIGEPLRSIKINSWSRKSCSSGCGSQFPSQCISTLPITFSYRKKIKSYNTFEDLSYKNKLIATDRNIKARTFTLEDFVSK